MTKKQQEWLNLQRLVAKTTPRRRYPRPTNPIRRFFHSTVLTDSFDRLMVLVIILDTVSMFLPHEGMSQHWSKALFACNAAFTGVYAIEALAKMMAAGIHGYFDTPWYRFEFAVLILCGINLMLNFASFAHYKPTFFPLLRMLRVLVIIKILPLVRGLYMMMVAVVWSLPAVFNVYLVVLVFIFIYAIIGMNLFGMVKFQTELNYNANFVSFPIAMLVMFRISTNDGWNYLMQDSMVLDNCILITRDVNASIFNGTSTSSVFVSAGTYLDSVDNSTLLKAIPLASKQEQCSPSPALAAIFYLSFVLIVSYLMVQLFISIIIECIEFYISREGDMLNQDHLSEFMDAWEIIDPYSTGFIPASSISSLIMSLKPPVGSKGLPHPNLSVQEVIFSTDIPMRTIPGSEVQGVHFLEVLHAIMGRVAFTDLPQDQTTGLYSQMIERLPSKIVDLTHNVADYYSALTLRAAIRGHLVRVRLHQLLDQDTAAAAEEALSKDYVISELSSPTLCSPFSDESADSSSRRRSRVLRKSGSSSIMQRMVSRGLTRNEKRELIEIGRNSRHESSQYQEGSQQQQLKRASNMSSQQSKEPGSPVESAAGRSGSFSPSPQSRMTARSLLKFSSSVEKSKLEEAATSLVKSSLSRLQINTQTSIGSPLRPMPTLEEA